MYIQSFHIDNFGVFSQLSVQGLSEGVTIFLGKNEAGKSTCLEFLRTMLTGYAPARSKEAQGRNFAQISPGRVGQAGGSLELYLEDHGLVHVTRRPDKSAGKGRDSVVLSDSQGNVLDASLLDSLLSGVTRDVYRNVFGFSLSELQVFESLKDEGVRHALYGASFGMGLRSPGAVLKELEGNMEKLFKVKGSTPFINDTLKQLERVQKELTELKRQCAQYDGLSLTKQTLEEGLTAVRAQKAACEEQRRQAERQLGVWKQWDEWRSIENTLGRLEPVADSFPEDGAGRLERAQVLRQDAARREATQKERYQKLEARRDALVVNELLLEKKAILQSLSEHKASFRRAQEGLQPQQAHIHRAEQHVAHSLAELGPQWTCERIHATNRSLVARSELESLAGHIQSTEQAHVANTTHLKKANTSVLAARHALELAQNTLEHLPVPQALVDQEGREGMRRSVSHIESCLEGLKEKEQALLQGQKTFARSIKPLSVRGLEGDKANFDLAQALTKLEALRQVQEEALALAHKAQEARLHTQGIESIVAQAQENEENARGRVERMRQHLRKNTVASRGHLDVRAKAIRSLRQMHNAFNLEKNRVAELEQRMQEAIAPEPVKSVLLMVLGSLIVACGLTGLALPIFFGLESLQITPRLILPLSQWSSYLVVLTGAAFLAGGLPRSGPERKRFEKEMKALQDRVTSMHLALTHTEGQIQEQCVLAEVTDADPITLDAVEVLLEREREKCATDERMQQDLEQLQAEHEEYANKLKLRRQEVTAAQQQEQKALLLWHDRLRAHDVQTIPSPDAAATFFARVEAALVAQASAQSLEEEVAQLQKSVEDHKQSLLGIPAVRQALESAEGEQALSFGAASTISAAQGAEEGDALGVEQRTATMPTTMPAEASLEKIFAAVREVLHICREADEALEERLKAGTSVQNCQYSLEMAEKSQEEFMEALHKSEKELQDSLQSWKQSLAHMGIDMDISPRMLRTVLECMEKCLQGEAEVQRLKEEQERMQRECQSFVQPLREVLEAVQRPLPQGIQNPQAMQKNAVPYQEDWLKSLDIVLLDLQTSQEALQVRGQLDEQLSAQEEELNEAATALVDAEATIKHLLRLGQTENPEEFIRLAHVRAQAVELLRRRDDLEDALRLAAGEKDLQEFLASFAQREQHECEAFLQEKEAELLALVAEEQEKMHEFAGVSATLHGLEHTDTMAKLRQEERQIQESLQDAGAKWAQYAVARQMLLQAKQRFEKERQPQVIRMASDIFAQITDNKWKGLTASLEESSLQVISPYGEPIAPTVLSRGTQEQLYLALRLAYIRNHAAHARALPVIMDDVLVNFDPERAERTASALLDLSQSGKRHQILFFTCHPYMAEMLQKNHAQSKLFMVENAQIMPA